MAVSQFEWTAAAFAYQLHKSLLSGMSFKVRQVSNAAAHKFCSWWLSADN
jgi:hypothetical protein